MQLIIYTRHQRFCKTLSVHVMGKIRWLKKTPKEENFFQQITIKCIHWLAQKVTICSSKPKGVIGTKGFHGKNQDPTIVNQKKSRMLLEELNIPRYLLPLGCRKIAFFNDRSSACHAWKDILPWIVSKKAKSDLFHNTPLSRATFGIPWRVCPLFLHNIRKDVNERILMVGAERLKSCWWHNWWLDEIFELLPEFYLVYAIHVELQGGLSTPCVYILLGNEAKENYVRMIELMCKVTAHCAKKLSL